jgi:hypothetical protein|tara:strand:- start:29 stop:604 length:576 start_codon:yes stop_codon:yes gene_type:complete
MVSLNTIITLGGIGAAYLLFTKLGGGAGIGSAIGSQISGFTEALGGQVTQAFNKFGNLVETPQSNAPNTAARVVEELDLGNYVTNIPDAPVGEVGLTPQQKGGLAFAGFLEDNNLGGTINLRTNEFENAYGVQPLDFTINGSGGINTGAVGLSNATLNAQAALSKKFGIPTFDTQGNLSTFGGLITGEYNG